MQYCQNCGTSLPENSQFCAQCGHALNLTTNMPTYSYNLINHEGMMQQSTGGSVKNEEEEERRRRILLGLPLLGATLGDAQPSAGNVPVVHGSPSTSGVPMVQGTPSISGASAAHSASSTPFNAPSVPGLDHPGMSLQPQGIQQPLISQPAQRPIMTHSGEFHHTASPPTRHPVAPLKRVPKHGLGSTPIWVVIPIVVIIIIGGILGTIFIILPPSMSLSGDTISGVILHLHGSNFFPGGTVVLTLDNGQGLTLVSPRGPVTVSGIGTFDASMSGTENWSVGQHTIHAIESSGGRNGVLSFTLNANHTQVTPNISSFSSPGDAHCVYHGDQGWICQIAISTNSHALGNLLWSVSSSGLNGITITPTSGFLTPGQAQQVTMVIPNTVCPASATFTFTFKGGEEPVSARWSCAVPKIYWDAVSCPQSNGYDVCPYILNVASGSEGLIHWTAFGNSPGILINPQSGTLAPGQSQPVSVAFPANPCTDTSWSVKDSAGNIIPAKLTCVPLG
jgi:hypothetical protein